MNHVKDVAVEITSPGMTTEGVSVSAVITANVQHTLPCDTWGARPRTIRDIIMHYQMTQDTISEPPQSSGSAGFTWTCQQLSETDWSGPQADNNSSSNSETAGKPGISETEGATVADPAVRTSPVGTSTNASTFMTTLRLRLRYKSLRRLRRL